MALVNGKRNEILTVAMEMLAERGYRGTSLNAVAHRVGLTRQGVLHYFPSKEALLSAILQRREELSREHLLAGHAEEDWPAQLAEVVAHDHDEPGLARAYSVLMAESVTDGHPAQEYFRTHYADVRARMTEAFARRWGDRLPSGLTPAQAATAVLALLDGMQQQWLLDRSQTGHPDTMRAVLTVLFGSSGQPA
ncbi:TetR/AcrR family transcriptional regulator [Cryptosporangium minutisporangium]|uniref:TetR/AcrR family transcriptional regulator n=1 Tax=Cryptosporangium minutisporangium TaxID=113569 RepID=A0ABP6SZ94_9ACTN